jgi:uncharacterized protein (DUF1330 family)
MIITCVIHDRAAFMAGYAPAAAALIAQFGGRYVLRAPGGEWFEGGFGEAPSVVVSEWPDRETARAFWTSPAYADVKTLRNGIADAQVLVVDGTLAV